MARENCSPFSHRGSHRRRRFARSLRIEPLESRKVLSAAGGGALAGPLQDVIVVLHDDVEDSRAAAVKLADHSQRGEVGHVYQHALKGFSAQVYAPKVIQNSPLVKYVEPDAVMHMLAHSVPTGVDRIGADTNSVASIDHTNQALDVDIAIIDTGIDVDHLDLNVVGGVRFYDAGGPPWNPKLGQDDNYDDDNGHGTHVAGTAAAIDDGVGVVGVAPGAKLWAVKVLDSRGSGTTSQVIAGMDWVTERASEIEVANMSLGGGYSQSINDALAGMTNAGVVVAVAAGNDGADAGNYSPASAETAITVSAAVDTDGETGGLGLNSGYGADDTLASFSNYGAVVDIAAPGVDIESTYAGGGYDVLSGTSMASPHVAGAAALEIIASGGRELTGTYVEAITHSMLEAAQAMTEWRDDTQDTASDPDNYHEPMVDVGEPVDQKPTVAIENPSDGESVSGSSVAVTASASDDVGITQVEFSAANWSHTDSDGSDGWSASWDTSVLDDGNHTLTATASDTAGQIASHSIGVEVDNVDDAPSVQITNPLDGTTVSGELAVTADAQDDRGISQVEFFADGSSLGIDSDATDGWSVLWDTTNLVSDGGHTLTATVTDTASTPQTASHSINVTVDNSVTVVHVNDLDGAVETNKNGWRASVTVTVLDANGQPVEGAKVHGDWSGGYTAPGVESPLTDQFGKTTLMSDWIHKKNESMTFSVTGVSKTDHTYDAASNEDAEGDSDGTTIIVSKDGTTTAPSSTEAIDAVMAGGLDD